MYFNKTVIANHMIFEPTEDIPYLNLMVNYGDDCCE